MYVVFICQSHFYIEPTERNYDEEEYTERAMNPRYAGGNIPSKAFRYLQKSYNDEQSKLTVLTV